MKLIGVLGGTSWPSTMLAYRLLNQGVQHRLGGHHSARILVYSIDYHEIKTRYWDRFDEIPALLRREINKLLSFQPDRWLIANNTLHKAYDLIADEWPGSPPLHAVALTRDLLVERGVRRALLLGTAFTMEDGFFASPLIGAGIDVVIPDQAERQRIQTVQSRLSKGEISETFTAELSAVLTRYEAAGCEAVIAACTELPLAIDPNTTSMLFVDPLELQCRAAVDYLCE